MTLASDFSALARMEMRIDGISRLLARPLSNPTTTKIRLPIPTKIQVATLDHPARFLVDCSGRGTGKTQASELKFDRAIRERPMPYWWVWPTFDAAREFAWEQYLRPHFDGIYPMSETTLTLHYPNGGYLRCVGADKMAAHNKRGGKLGGFIMEECRNVKRHVYSEVLLPMVARTGGWGQFKSTPRPGSWFDILANEAEKKEAAALAAGERPEWGLVSFTPYDNPHHDQAGIEMMRRNMTEREFEVEVMGRRLTDGGMLFRNVSDLCVLEPAAPMSGRNYVIGADWARHNDETVFSVWDVKTRRQVRLDRYADTPYHLQDRAAVALARMYNDATVFSEDNGIGDERTERLEYAGVRVVRFHSDPGRKRDLVLGGAMAFEQRNVALLRDEEQVAQLMAFETQPKPSGLPGYGAPSGMHDDIVIADLLGIAGLDNDSTASDEEVASLSGVFG